MRRWLLAAGLLVAIGGVVWVLTRPAPAPTPPDIDLERVNARTGNGRRPSPGEREGEREAERPPGPLAAPSTTGPVIGSREPSGIDLSDPSVVREALRRAVLGTPPDWAAARRLVALLEGSLDAEVRDRLLEALRGPDGMQAKETLAVARDGRLVSDLLDLLEDPSGPLRASVLDILARMPGASSEEVVLGLEARLAGEPMSDALLLRAIARRGGKEAARAIVDYLRTSPDPLRVPGRLGLGMQLRDDPDAMRAIADALQAAERADVVVALAGLAAEPGAEGLVPALVALDGEERPDEVRGAALDALAQIGTGTAVEHLLEAAEGEGPRAETALRALGRMTNADEKARDMLMAALEDAENRSRPTEARRHLLGALANLGHAAAGPAFRGALDDPDDRVRQSAALGIGRLGTGGRAYVDDLMRAYASSDRRVQRTLVQALGMVGGDEARSLLEQMQSDSSLHPELQRAVRSAMGRFPPREREETPDPDGGLRGARR